MFTRALMGARVDVFACEHGEGVCVCVCVSMAKVCVCVCVFGFYVSEGVISLTCGYARMHEGAHVSAGECVCVCVCVCTCVCVCLH
jgi:hypothetical protein